MSELGDQGPWRRNVLTNATKTLGVLPTKQGYRCMLTLCSRNMRRTGDYYCCVRTCMPALGNAAYLILQRMPRPRVTQVLGKETLGGGVRYLLL